MLPAGVSETGGGGRLGAVGQWGRITLSIHPPTRPHSATNASPHLLAARRLYSTVTACMKPVALSYSTVTRGGAPPYSRARATSVHDWRTSALLPSYTRSSDDVFLDARYSAKRSSINRCITLTRSVTTPWRVYVTSASARSDSHASAPQKPIFTRNHSSCEGGGGGGLGAGATVRDGRTREWLGSRARPAPSAVRTPHAPGC